MGKKNSGKKKASWRGAASPSSTPTAWSRKPTAKKPPSASRGGPWKFRLYLGTGVALLACLTWLLLTLLTPHTDLIVFAVNNRHFVEVSLWPLDSIRPWPLFVLVYIGVVAGVLAGAAVAWTSGVQRHRRARRRGSKENPGAAASHRVDDAKSRDSAGTTAPAVID